MVNLCKGPVRVCNWSRAAPMQWLNEVAAHVFGLVLAQWGRLGGRLSALERHPG